MKTLVLGLSLLVLTIGVAPALAQTSTLSPATPPGSSVDAPTAPDTVTAPDVKAPDAYGTAPLNGGDDTTGAASPRTDTVRHFSIFGLSSTASIVLSAALLLGVIPAIVAMTRIRGTTHTDTTNRAVAPVATLMAAPGRSPANPETSPNPGRIPGTAETPTTPRVKDQKLDYPAAAPAPERASDVPAARNDAAFNLAADQAVSPRMATDDDTRIFGMRPLIAAMVGAAGLLGIILAISMVKRGRRGPRSAAAPRHPPRDRERATAPRAGTSRPAAATRARRR